MGSMGGSNKLEQKQQAAWLTALTSLSMQLQSIDAKPRKGSCRLW